MLVNNVGAVRLRLEGFLGTSDEEFEWAMQMNFFAALRATRAAITAMVAQGQGAIVNVASVNAFFQPDAGTIDYGAAKAALLNLSKSLAQEFGPHGIHVNCVSPGPVGTDLWLGKDGVAETVARATGVDAEQARAAVVASIGGFATGRFTTPEEVATLITVPRLRARGQHHGRQLRDRRRPDQDDLSERRAAPAVRAAPRHARRYASVERCASTSARCAEVPPSMTIHPFPARRALTSCSANCWWRVGVLKACRPPKSATLEPW